jgi:hypothetical protein
MAYKFRPKKMPHPPSHMEKEGGVGIGLKTIIKKGITITNLTKRKPQPPFQVERMGVVIIIG